MFKRILVPLDGSERAERALPVAAQLARATGGSIVLLRVVYSPTEYRTYLLLTQQMTAEFPEATEAQEAAAASDHLKQVAHSDVLAGIDTETKVLTGSVAPTILSVASDSGIDALVMCSHGSTGFKRWMLGSVAQKIATHSPVPILVLRESSPGSTPLHPSPEQPLRVLIPLDGSATSEAVLKPTAHFVAAVAGSGQGALHLVRIVDLPSTDGHWRSQSYITDGMIEQEKQAAHSYLSTIAARFQQEPLVDLKLAVTCSVVVEADVAHAILKIAEQGEEAEGAGTFGRYDLIAMGTHGRSGLPHWALGSITERILGATQLPLFVVRPPKPHVSTKSARTETQIEMGSALL